MFKKSILSTFFLLLLISCSDDSFRVDNSQILIDGSDKFERSSTAGNLMASAIQKEHDLDVVLYPSEFISDENMGILKENMDVFEREQILKIFPKGKKDKILIGRMSGKGIKKFITRRAQKTGSADLEVAGIKYDVKLMGGLVQHSYVKGDINLRLKDDEFYKVGLSYYMYDFRQNFPGYFYGDNLSRDFHSVDWVVSARESLESFLKDYKSNGLITFPRANCRKIVRGDAGFLKTYEIQGSAHRSLYYGYQVQTRGVVTAFGKMDRGPKGMDIYIQDPQGDGRLETSDGLRLYLKKGVDVELGDLIDVTGVIYEEMTTTGLTRTGLNDISSLKVVSKEHPLPPAEKLGQGGRKIPTKKVSTWRGDLNTKPFLNLQDGVDFWESLEGMRVGLTDLRVLGFRGGQEEFEALRPKDYLNLYVVADAKEKKEGVTAVDGLMIDPLAGDFNPEIVQLQANHLSKGFSTSTYFNVGDIIEGEVEGVLTYEMNIFGSGEWAIVLPEPQKSIESDFQGRGLIGLEQRPVSKLASARRQLSIATYNVENLAGNQNTRIKEMARVVRITLACPDIVNLVEIQDNNGIDFTGGSAADVTLRKFLKHIDCPDKDYRAINKDPLNHSEGGQPGGNIRVSMIYDANKLSFDYRPSSDPLAHTTLDGAGNLSHNPGRIFPQSSEFRGTRKSIVAQFGFQGEQVYVIGNHFNSKLGDSSAWSNIQPVTFRSEQKRSGLARMVNKFVQIIENKNPQANIAVVGDFNAYTIEASMSILAGRHLQNLMTYKDLIPKNKRYTTNYNGSSQALDYIFVNKNFLMKKPEHEVLHINSDFMGRLSDHDPLIARFSF